MSSLPPSPAGAESESDYSTNKKKKTTIVTNTTRTRPNNRMTLRDATQRRRPGRYREAEEIPDTRPAWVHPPVAFNADLTRFVAPYSLPMDSPNGFPSRERYNAWQAEKLAEGKRNKTEAAQQQQNDLSSYASVRVRPEVLNGTSKGPDTVHLPSLAERRREQRQILAGESEGAGASDDEQIGDENDQAEAASDETMAANLKWQDLSKPAQWALIDYQVTELQFCDLHLPDAFRVLHLRLGDIIEFAEMYNHEKKLYEEWRARIKATDPAMNDLEHYHNAWTNVDLIAYFVSKEDIHQGKRYLHQIEEDDVDDLKNSMGCRHHFFEIAGMDDLDVAFLKEAAQHGVDTEYGDLTRESINWVSIAIPEGSNDEIGEYPVEQHQVMRKQVDQVEPRTPMTFKQKVKPTNLVGIASDADDADDDEIELSSPFDINFPYIVEKPLYYTQNYAVAHSPVELPQETLRPIDPNRSRNSVAEADHSPDVDIAGQQTFDVFGFGKRDPAQPSEHPASQLLFGLSSGNVANQADTYLPLDFVPQPDLQPFQLGLLPLPQNDGPNDPQHHQETVTERDLKHEISQAQRKRGLSHAGYDEKGIDAGDLFGPLLSNDDSQVILEDAPIAPGEGVMNSEAEYVPQNEQAKLPLQDASFHRDLHDLTGFPPRFLGFYDVETASSTSSVCAYERRVMDFEAELQESTETNLAAVYQANNNQQSLNPVANADHAAIIHPGSSLPLDLAFDEEWYAAQQPVSFSFPCDPIPGWGDQCMWDPMIAQYPQADQNEGGVLASFIPGQPAPNSLIDPRLLDVRNSDNVMGNVPLLGRLQPARPQITMAQAHVAVCASENMIGSAMRNAHELNGALEADDKAPTKGHASQPTVESAATTPTQSSAPEASVRLSLVETSSGQAVLQREPMAKNEPSTTTHRIPSKRAWNEVEHDESEPVEAKLTCQRGRAHRKETDTLESDEDFVECSYPICESDDDDWEPSKRKNSRKTRKVSGPSKEKKTGEALKGKKTGEAPKRQNTRGRKAAKKQDDAPVPDSVPTTVPPEMTGPAAASLPALFWPHNMMSGFEYGMNSPRDPSTGLHPATAGPNERSALLTPPASNVLPALVTSGWEEVDLPLKASGAANNAGGDQATVSEPPAQKPKRKYSQRPKKDQGDKAASKPKRTKTKKTDTAKKDAGTVPLVGRKETPVPLPAMLQFHAGENVDHEATPESEAPPTASQQQTNTQFQGANSPNSIKKGTYLNPISAEEFNAMSSRGETLSFGQPQATSGPAAEASAPAPTYTTEQPFLVMPAISGVPIIPQACYPRPESPSLVDAFTGLYGPSLVPHPTASAVPSPAKPSSLRPIAPAPPNTAKRFSVDSGGAAGKNTVARNIQRAQKKIKASIQTPQPAFPTASAQPSTPQSESFFMPIKEHIDSPKQKKSKATRKNTLDPKTGKPRVGRPRARKPQAPSTEPQQLQTEQIIHVNNAMAGNGVNAPANEPQKSFRAADDAVAEQLESSQQ